MVPELDSVEIIVDRQKDIASEFTKAMGKAKGGAGIVLVSMLYRPGW